MVPWRRCCDEVLRYTETSKVQQVLYHLSLYVAIELRSRVKTADKNKMFITVNIYCEYNFTVISWPRKKSDACPTVIRKKGHNKFSSLGNCWKPLVSCRPTVGQLLADRLPTGYQQARNNSFPKKTICCENTYGSRHWPRNDNNPDKHHLLTNYEMRSGYKYHSRIL